MECVGPEKAHDKYVCRMNKKPGPFVNNSSGDIQHKKKKAQVKCSIQRGKLSPFSSRTPQGAMSMSLNRSLNRRCKAMKQYWQLKGWKISLQMLTI